MLPLEVLSEGSAAIELEDIFSEVFRSGNFLKTNNKFQQFAPSQGIRVTFENQLSEKWKTPAVVKFIFAQPSLK